VQLFLLVDRFKNMLKECMHDHSNTLMFWVNKIHEETGTLIFEINKTW